MSAWNALLPQRWRIGAYIAAAVLSIAIFVYQLAADDLFPMWRDTITHGNGLGAGELMGTPLPDVAKLVLTGLASVGGILLLAALAGALVAWRRDRQASRFDIALFALVIGLATLAPIALITLRFDRYLISVIPCMLLALSVLLARTAPWRGGLIAGFVTITLVGLVSAGAIHDFMAYKRVHWAAYVNLTRTVPARFVDAGWITNGAANYGRYGRPDRVQGWFERADYLVGTRRRRGYAVIETYPVERWLPWNRNGRALLVQKLDPGTVSPHRDVPGGRRLQRCRDAGRAGIADADLAVRGGCRRGARLRPDAGLHP
jgi:hypothetical protein